MPRFLVFVVCLLGEGTLFWPTMVALLGFLPITLHFRVLNGSLSNFSICRVLGTHRQVVRGSPDPLDRREGSQHLCRFDMHPWCFLWCVTQGGLLRPFLWDV